MVTNAAIILQTENLTKKNQWFDEECRNVIKERNVLRMYILQDSTAENIEEYSKARSLTNKTPREKKRLSEKKKIDVIEAYKINPRLFFKKFK